MSGTLASPAFRPKKDPTESGREFAVSVLGGSYSNRSADEMLSGLQAAR